MRAVVRKSSPVVVRPSRPVTMSDTIKLSSFDKGFEKVPVTSLLVFENPIHDPANTIMRALSEALVHYHPLAGRLVAGIDGGEIHILCNGEGVTFISASSNCALKEAIFLDQSPPCERALLEELAAVSNPANCCGPTDPLLLMQVTKFSCGGFVLGVTWNHAVADGAGIAQFLQAVGELARAMPSPSIVPVRLDDSLPCLPPSVVAQRYVAMTLDPLGFTCLDITVPSRSVNLIKAGFGNRFDCQPCSMFEVVTAILWQCRTRAIMSSPGTPAILVFAANVRKHVGAKPGYYGNCITTELVMATSGAVANADILDLVKMIKRTKENIPHTFNVDPISNPTDANKGQMEQLDLQLRYNMLMVSSWRNLGFEETDFGSGKVARVTSYGEGKQLFPVCIACLPWQGEGGANVISACVKEEHVQAFLQELAKFNM